jgi:hypothetical protein
VRLFVCINMGLSGSKEPAVVTEQQIKDARAILDIVDKNRDGVCCEYVMKQDSNSVPR